MPLEPKFTTNIMATNGELVSLYFKGHSNAKWIGLYPGSSTWDPATDHMGGIRLGRDGNTYLVNGTGQILSAMSTLMEGKFAKNGEFWLLGCETAKGENNIARAISNNIRNTTVYGSPNKTRYFPAINKWPERFKVIISFHEKTYINNQCK